MTATIGDVLNPILHLDAFWLYYAISSVFFLALIAWAVKKTGLHKELLISFIVWVEMIPWQIKAWKHSIKRHYAIKKLFKR